MQKNAFCFRIVFTFYNYTDIFMICCFFARRWFFFIRFEFETKLLHIDFRQPGQFFFEDGEIPTGEFACFVIREAIGFHLLVGQVFSHDHRHLFQPQLFCGLVACVSGNDYAVAVDYNRLLPAELLDAGRHRVNGTIVVARVSVIRPDICDFYEFNFHVSILSAGSGRVSIL